MSAQLKDNLARTGDFDAFGARPTRSIEDYSPTQQLDALEIACRRPKYRAALDESITEADGFYQLTAALKDSCISDAALGRMLRERSIQYVEACAQLRGESLVEFVS